MFYCIHNKSEHNVDVFDICRLSLLMFSDAMLGGTCEPDKTGQCSDTAAQCLTNTTAYICTCGPNYYDENGFTMGGSCSPSMLSCLLC